MGNFLKILAKPLVLVLGLVLFSFALMEIKPGDPALALTGQSTNAEALERARAEYGLDRPFWERVWYSLGNYLNGDFGKNLDGRPVADILGEAFPRTLRLGALAALIAFGLAIFLAALSLEVPRAGGPVNTGQNFLLATPVYILALLLLYVFYFYGEMLPPGGYGDGSLTWLVLPAASLGLKSMARQFFFLRDLILQEKQSNWYQAWRMRGFFGWRLYYPFLLLKILPGYIGLVLLELGGLFAGAIVVEQIFFFPGLGRQIFDALVRDDRGLLQALILFSGLIFISLNSLGRLVIRLSLGEERH